jgi:hypothetical protein
MYLAIAVIHRLSTAIHTLYSVFRLKTGSHFSKPFTIKGCSSKNSGEKLNIKKFG